MGSCWKTGWTQTTFTLSRIPSSHTHSTVADREGDTTQTSFLWPPTYHPWAQNLSWIQAVVQPEITPLRRRFNFKKADWKGFAEDLEQSIGDLEPIPKAYEQFVDRVRTSSRRCIPRGCRTKYVPGLSPDFTAIYASYRDKFEADPLSADTIAAEEALSAAISSDRRKSWQYLIESVDMTHNSKKAWYLIKTNQYESCHTAYHSSDC